jgi:hypothetical protein
MFVKKYFHMHMALRGGIFGFIDNAHIYVLQQSALVVIQGTLVVIQGTLGVIQGT